MKAHISLDTTRSEIFNPYSLVKWALIPTAFISANLVLFLLFVFYSVETYLLFKEIKGHYLKRPQWTSKAVLVFVISFFTTLISPFAIARFLSTSDGLSFAFADRLILLITSLVVLLFWPISIWLKKRVANSARTKMNEKKGLVSIGITGSYGKSTTKEILASLLQEQDLVVTPGNTNTEIGVAEIVVKKIKPETKYFISEMGAYKKGEIKRITDMIKPKYGVITAISNQHLSLFGTIENLKKAKYELIESLPNGGIAFFNNDDMNCRELAVKTTNCRVIKFSASQEADYKAIGKVNELGLLEGTLITPKGSKNFTSQILGEYNLVNIAGATAVASELGIPLEEIAERLSRVTNPKRTMESIRLSDGTLVVDDSYSGNEVGVIAAIRSIQKFFDKQKIIVMMPIIELGAESTAVHERLGEELGKYECKIFYPQKDFVENIKKGLEKSGSDNRVTYVDSEIDLVEKVKKLRGEKTLILLEGRVPRRLRESLLKDRVK